MLPTARFGEISCSFQESNYVSSVVSVPITLSRRFKELQSFVYKELRQLLLSSSSLSLTLRFYSQMKIYLFCMDTKRGLSH
jgi:hypothetical protein